MKKFKQSIILVVLTIAIIFATNEYVYATTGNWANFIKKTEYSDEFVNWTKLSSSEKSKIFIPTKIFKEANTDFENYNPIYQSTLVGASVNSKFSLQDVIKDNVQIRNQYDTSECWAFAGLSSLETNLALKNYNSGSNQRKIYDYSERHANYATTRLFKDGQINEFGYNRKPNDGGQWAVISSYLTNGQGAVNEGEMPFENNSNLVDISEIQNKEVQTRVYDTVKFDNYNKLSGDERTNAMNEIKQHVQNYGSVFAYIHGDSSSSIYSCYNNSTGAKYCNTTEGHGVDHAVSIIGWDDNYSVDNFSKDSKPSQNGAWIVRNSWGTELDKDLNEYKKEVFEANKSACISRGWNSGADIPNDTILELVPDSVIEDGKIKVKIGDNGYMYVSYEDVNVGTNLYGIIKASDEKDYDNLYQYDELFPGELVTLSSSKVLVADEFTKKSNGPEWLTGISMTAPETYKCRVYVNPNGTGKTKEDLQEVKLDAGSTETIDYGFHTLEFAEPVKINSNEFTVVVEITGTRDNTLYLQLESKIDGIDLFDDVKTETGKCFVGSTTNPDTSEWFDLGTLESLGSGISNGDLSIKAYTIENYKDDSLNRIEIVTPPTRTVYNEGEDFDKSGMIVKAIFNNDTSTILSDEDYSITNGSNLKYGQGSVTITYQDKTVEQTITVVKKENPQDPEKDDDNKEDVKPVSTNFSNAKVTLATIRSYNYSDDSTKAYTEVDTEIKGITRNLANDSTEYYYYISPKSTFKAISPSNWTKIDENQTLTDRIAFTVDSRKIPNYDEVSKATTLYIYIREVAVKGGNQVATVSKALTFEKGSATVVDKYLDGKIAGTSSGTGNSGNNSSNNNKSNNSNAGQTTNNRPTDSGKATTTTRTQGQTSNTIAPMNLPKTGGDLVLIGIIIIASLGVISFIRYEILRKSMK